MHFKMEPIQNMLNVIKKDTFMASIDLLDPFYFVPVTSHHPKYLKRFANKYLKFEWMPNEYGPYMRIFTIITKIPFSVLRMQDHTSVAYADDSYLQGDSYEICMKNVNNIINMFWQLGFTIYPEKSVLKPTKNLIYLGFIIESKVCNWQRRKKNFDLCLKHFEKSKPIQFVAQVIGN